MSPDTQLIDTITTFLKEIGLEVVMRPIDGSALLQGLSMDDGKVIIDIEKLKYPGDILHEAGHLAVMPPDVRRDMGDVLPATDMHQGGEIMALAWSYAACIHLGIDPHIVFHADGYKGEGEHIVKHFREAPQWGIPLLQWCGMTYDSKKAAELNKLPFPNMQRWLREN
jgi:hypothetical protein